MTNHISNDQENIIREIFELIGFRGSNVEEAIGKLALLTVEATSKKMFLSLDEKKRGGLMKKAGESSSEAGVEMILSEGVKRYYSEKEMSELFKTELVKTLNDYLGSVFHKLDADRRKVIEAKLVALN